MCVIHFSLFIAAFLASLPLSFICLSLFLLSQSPSFTQSALCVRQLSFEFSRWKKANHFITRFFPSLLSHFLFRLSFFCCSLHRSLHFPLSGVICVGSHCLDNRLYRIMREREGGGDRWSIKWEREREREEDEKEEAECQTEREKCKGEEK